MRLGKIGSFDIWGSFIITPGFTLAHDLPTFLYISIANMRWNLMIRFKWKDHGYKGRYVLLNGRYVLAS